MTRYFPMAALSGLYVLIMLGLAFVPSGVERPAGDRNNGAIAMVK